ncbi:MAG: PAAR domain-containing protein [Leptolyngbyaceae cyanobacterium]
MGTPAARLGDLTLTGDPVTGPCIPNVLIGGQPAAVVGDSVSGTVCVGVIAIGSPTVIISGRPAARMGSTVEGVNAVSGVKMTTSLGIPCYPTVLIA